MYPAVRGLELAYEDLIRASMGESPLDLVIRNACLVNVYTGETYRSEIGIRGDKVAYVGEPGAERLRAIEEFDAEGMYAIPGFIDSHLHVESSMVTPARFAEAVLPHGTTTVAIDPHEVANVLGKEGVRMMIESSRGLPLKVHVLAPTCVPSTPGFETAGAEFYASDVREMLRWDGVIGLAEVMDYHGLIGLDRRTTEIVKAGIASKVVVDGHCPGLRGKGLNAYAAAGIEADHESLAFEEVLEKLRLGMLAKLRRGIISRELVEKLKGVPDRKGILLVTDDVMPDDLVKRGHLDYVVRLAIQSGLDPIEAIQASTLRPARHLRLFDRGAIAPGKLADIVLAKDLERLDVDVVFADGKAVAKDGRLLRAFQQLRFSEGARGTVRALRPGLEDFLIRAPFEQGKVRARVIDVRGFGGLETFFSEEDVKVIDGFLRPDGLATVVVFERHGRTGGRAQGLIGNMGLREGAVASTVSHDCHNLIVFGT